MTPPEALELGKRIINTWHGGPPLADWTETLQPLNQPLAVTAYNRLRNDQDHAPTIARYLATYRGLQGPPPDRPLTYTERATPGAISRSDYMARLTARADAGDDMAQAELAAWKRHS